MFDRLARGIAAVGESVKKESGKEFMLDAKYGYIHSCPTNLGTGMRASVHVDLPGYTKEGLPALKKRCEELKVQPRGTRGESGGQTGKLGNNIAVLWLGSVLVRLGRLTYLFAYLGLAKGRLSSM